VSSPRGGLSAASTMRVSQSISGSGAGDAKSVDGSRRLTFVKGDSAAAEAAAANSAMALDPVDAMETNPPTPFESSSFA
jgi:hypothetical protein